MSELVELKGITKDYYLGRTTVTALRGVDLTIHRGEFMVIMGPSGSGKSTLLNIIGCLDQPTAGTYVLDGIPVGERDFDKLADIRNRKIGFIFQMFNLIPVLNVVENIEFPCLMRRGDREDAKSLRQRVIATAEDVGLGPFLEHKPDELSGGQRQRVAIARALITNPEMVLADEPTANLDSVTSEQIVELMLRLNQEKHVTFVFSTHDPRMVRHARRVVRIGDGRLIGDEQKEAGAALA